MGVGIPSEVACLGIGSWLSVGLRDPAGLESAFQHFAPLTGHVLFHVFASMPPCIIHASIGGWEAAGPESSVEGTGHFGKVPFVPGPPLYHTRQTRWTSGLVSPAPGPHLQPPPSSGLCLPLTTPSQLVSGSGWYRLEATTIKPAGQAYGICYLKF